VLADEIQLNIDAMSQLRTDLLRLRDSLETGDFESIGGSMPEFGAFDHSPMLQSHHQKAHGVMLETVKAVIECIDTFYTNLVRAQEAFDDVDALSMRDFVVYRQAVENLTAQSHLPGLEERQQHYRNEHDGADGFGGSEGV
jgi:hypothetical protein